MSDTQYQERRSTLRLKMEAEVELKLLVPHETFSPRSLSGRTIDISAGGLGLVTYDLTKREYGEILRGMSHAKLTVVHPFFSQPLQLAGKVVWSSFHDPRPGKPAHCFLGISFHPFSRKAREELDAELLRAQENLTASRIDLPRQ
ncbi:MAG: PilZ domain [Candidatus Sumerlaeota bacterium]|nr:PilZ domain [Candidatus Sumerlaeota bacterium]